MDGRSFNLDATAAYPELPPMPKPVFSDGDAAVKRLRRLIANEVRALLASVDLDTSPADLERRVADMALGWGRDVLGLAWSEQCRQATVADIEERGLDLDHVRLRSPRDYTWMVSTTLGMVAVVAFAYRDTSVPVGSVTRVPARDVVMPLHRYCRSSPLCLQWECRLGAQRPFRGAQADLAFFTHGATRQHDTTIADHLLAVGEIIDTSWLYRCPDEIREILERRAARDRETGRPALYISSDAHMIRRYVDDTWQAAWKNVNGIRLWCIDKDTGAIIHLGGEYTTGDCHVVQDGFRWLVDIGVLPPGGDYGHGVIARYVVVTDGAPWLVDRVADELDDCLVVLDAWHAMEYLADHATALYGKGKRAAKRLYNRMVEALFGRKPSRRRRQKTRRGHRKRRPGTPRRRRPVTPTQPAGPEILLSLLREHEAPTEHAQAHAEFIAKIERNADRMDYPALRNRGLNIGSGAMESLHRTGSQQRLKLPGAKWLARTMQAVLDLRMLEMVGRWDEFWRRPQLLDDLRRSFAAQPAAALEEVL